MFTIDEIRIEGEEDGFHLIVYTDDGEPQRFRIGLPDQFRAEVERTIGRWLAEGEKARAAPVLAEDDFDADGYDMSDIYDNREGK